jgi:hypothetical protein
VKGQHVTTVPSTHRGGMIPNASVLVLDSLCEYLVLSLTIGEQIC